MLNKSNHLLISGLILLHFVLLTPTTCVANSRSPDSLLIRIDGILKGYQGSNKPGFTVGIIDHGKLVYQRGFGMSDISRNIPNGPDKLYNIASVSKQFTAAAISELIHNGQISLTDDIRKYLPELFDYGNKITIDNLLYHTSGIRDYMVLMWLTGISFESEFSNEKALEIIFRQQVLNFNPGHRCVYSNSNYVLLAEILRRRTGQTFDGYVKEHLFIPFDMRSSGFDLDRHKASHSFALSYKNTKKGFVAYKNLNHSFGDGGMLTSLNDLQKWDQQFYRPESIAGVLLKPGSLVNGNLLTYGRGIMTGKYRNETIHFHPGAFLGYRSEILRFPDRQVTIILLGNSEEIDPERLTRKIADAYVFNDKSFKENDFHTLSVQDKKNRSPLIGRYEVSADLFIDISLSAGQLWGQVSGQPRKKLYPKDNRIFMIENSTDSVFFDTDSLSNISKLVVAQKQGKTSAVKLNYLSGKAQRQYCGTYYSAEQKAYYKFSISKGSLYFKVGNSPKELVKVFEKYDLVNLNYQYLEKASISFKRHDNGEISGFTLSSGRIAALEFRKVK